MNTSKLVKNHLKRNPQHFHRKYAHVIIKDILLEQYPQLNRLSTDTLLEVVDLSNKLRRGIQREIPNDKKGVKLEREWRVKNNMAYLHELT